MKRFNLAIDDDTHKELLSLKKTIKAASITEVLRRAVNYFYKATEREVKNRRSS